MNSIRTLVLGLALAAGASSVQAQPAPASAPAITKADSPDLQKLIDGVAPKLVTIKFILKMEMGGQMGDYGTDAEESEQEAAGILIDGKGLVLTSSTTLGGFADMFGAGSGVSATPKDVKVLIGDDTEGLKAEVVARDKELDLAWVRITETVGGDGKPRSFDSLEVSKSGAAKVGDRIYIVEKLSKFFDRAPIVLEDKIAGFTKKPRALMVPMGILAPSLGKPVFTGDGTLLGVIVVQMPGADETAGQGEGDMRSLGMILPASEITKATERAMATTAVGAKPGAAKPVPPAPPAPPATPK